MARKNKEDQEKILGWNSLSRKLGLAFGILILIILITAFLAYTLNVAVWDDANAIRTINAPLTVMSEQVIGYDAMLTSNVEAALLHSMNGNSAGVAEHKAWYDKQVALLDNLLKTDALALIKKSRRSLEEKELVYGYLNQLDEIDLKLVDLETRSFAAMEKNDTKTASSLITGETYQNYKTILRDLYNKWTTGEQRIAEYYRQRALLHNLEVRYINLSLAIILILALTIIPFLIFKTIVKPIRKLTEVTDDISSGDLNIKIPNNLKKNKSEIGSLARAFDKLLESSHFALKTLLESKMRKREFAVTGREKKEKRN